MKIYLTSGTSWSVATDGSPITVECIGGGGGGTAGQYSSGGGAGYAKATVPYVSGASVNYVIGAGGAGVAGGDTNWNSGVIIGRGGLATGSNGGAGGGGYGGTATGLIGYTGGAGSPYGGGKSACGGGAAGPNGNGGNGESITNGVGGVGDGGTGGAGNGGNGTEMGSGHGSGGGNSPGGNGGQSGGGAGGTSSTGTTGGGGLIVITYNPAPVPPTVTTPTSSSIGVNSATLGGNVTADGGATVTARGICWGTSPSPRGNINSMGSGTGVFTGSVSGLPAQTLIYFCAYATNSVGTTYSSDGTFTTFNVPTVTQSAITGIVTLSGTGNGNVTSDGGSAITSRGFCWNTVGSPTTSDKVVTASGRTGTFISNILGLLPSTQYYVRAFATNAFGTTYSNQVSFTTYRDILENWIIDGDFETAPTYVAAQTASNWVDGTAAGATVQNDKLINAVLNSGATARFDTNAPHGGSKCFHIALAGGGYSECRVNCNFYYGIGGMQILPNTTYQYSVWLKTANITGSSADGQSIQILVSDASGNNSSCISSYSGAGGSGGACGQFSLTPKILTNQGWTQYTGTFKTASNAGWFHTEYWVHGNTGAATLAGDFYFDDVSVTRAYNPSFSDLASSLVVSGYKWLTQTLYNAQQKFTTRPWFTCKIIDDSIKPTGIQQTGGAPYYWGSASKTPDDNIVAAGFETIFNVPYIFFYKGRNLGVNLGTWDLSRQMDTGSAIEPSGSQINQVQIAVSDYHQGTYHIDLAYLTNFYGTMGSYLILNMWRSEDGGNTWTLAQITTDIPYNSLPTNLYIALMKPRLVNGVMTSGFIYLSPTGVTMASGYPSYNLKYSLYPNSAITTWGGNVNSQDWTIHSFDSFYLNGIDYIVFSGFRNIIDNPNSASAKQNPNYELWITTLNRRASSASSIQVWTPPISIFPANANTPTNQNSYTYPKASVQNGFVDIVFQSVTTSAIANTAQGSSSTVVTTTTQYMHSKSQDGINYSYPDILVDINGNYILPTLQNNLQSFVTQDNFYYICGGNQIYQFIYNNVVADISSDIIGYTITETAGQASSVNLQVANQNNKWVGSNPTQPGAAALIGNAKIALQQGFYNVNGLPEVGPKNIFFIDDIQANVTSTNNDLTIIGRDWFKKLIVLATRFALQWIGPFFYTDIFDGSTLANWNQELGTWSESNNQLVAAATTNSTDSVIILTGIQQITQGSLMTVNVGPVGTTSGAGASIYMCYWDATHFIRLDITFQAGSQIYWQVVVNSGTGVGGYYSGTLAINPSNWVSGNMGFVIRQYDYYKFNIFISNLSTAVANNPLSMWNNCTILGGEIDLTSIFISTPGFQKPWSVGLGTTPWVYSTSVISIPFSYFRYVQLGPNTNILSVSESIANEAGIFTQLNSPPVVPNPTVSSVAEQQFVELMFNPSFSGQFSIQNRNLVIPPTGAVYNTDPTKVISDGTLSFMAKVIPTGGSTAGFYCTFRGSGTFSTYFNTYIFRIFQSSTGFVGCDLRRLTATGTEAVFPNNPANDPTVGVPTYGSLNIDITQYHQYQIVTIGGWLYAFIDGIMVAAWNDNNTDLPYLTSGYWGFGSNGDATVWIQNITSPEFWKPVTSFSLNPGDDAENAILSLTQQVRGWTFSDLLGRMKYVLLSASDQPNFTYDNQIIAQSTDNSDKEYISQVTVYGTGVMATAVNTNLMAGVPVRDAVIVDYTIMNQGDAQTRANLELLNYNQYLNQYEPTEVLNPGSELFDVVNVINTGNNTSGVSSPSRIYGQTFTQGGGTTTSAYSVQISTGNV